MHYKLMLQNQVEGLTASSWSFTAPAVVGREPGVGVCIDHDSISRKHCQFSHNGEGALVVKDLESMNGTYVNDSRVQQKVLMPGEIVQLGTLRLRIDFLSEPEKRPVPHAASKGSLYTTQPMETFRPVAIPPEKSWWRKLLG